MTEKSPSQDTGSYGTTVTDLRNTSSSPGRYDPTQDISILR